jgi:hypothetical protein
MSDTERMVLVSAVVFAGMAIALLASDRLGLGRLPGDVSARTGRVVIPFPLGTTALVSAVLSLAVAVAVRAT